MNTTEFNRIAERARSTLRVTDFEELKKATTHLRRGALIVLRGASISGSDIPCEFVALQDDRVLVRDTLQHHRLRGRTGSREVHDVALDDVRALPETKFLKRRP